MSEYGEQKGLQEILQDLVTYCQANTGGDVNLKLHLPKSVLGQFSMSFQPTPKITLSGEPGNSIFSLSKIYLNGGTVELES
jgi:hypothetical protein